MKHGIKLRKLQRTPSHRWALLRNLVAALLHHETIKTTVPKAKEAARLAEKIITLGKKGTDPARRSAMAFLMPSHHYSETAMTSSQVVPLSPMGYPASSSSSSSSSEIGEEGIYDSESPEGETTYIPAPRTILPKLFTTLSTRYASRPGGYTRIQKFGKRYGDNAPMAIVSLVDGPRDLKFELVARATGRERVLEDEREMTRRNREKVLRFRDEGARGEFEAKVVQYQDIIVAEEKASDGIRRYRSDVPTNQADLARTANPYVGRRYLAGEKMSGMNTTHTGLGLARGDLGRRWRGEERDQAPRFISPALGA